MRKRFCEQETSALAAAMRGDWDPELRRHVDECPACSEVALVAGFMNEAEADFSEAHLPDAEFVWWKAQLKARRAAAERATQPIAVMERIACAAGGLALVAVLAFLWPSLGAWVDAVTSSWLQGSQAAPALAVGVASVFGLGLVSVLFAVGIGLYSAWSDR